jgi:hypothetical protein
MISKKRLLLDEDDESLVLLVSSSSYLKFKKYEKIARKALNTYSNSWKLY